MSSLRLKQNLIINGKFHPSGSLLDKALIPPKFLTETYVADPQNREGRVLLLRNLSFMSRPKPDSSGVATSYPVHVGAGELFDLAQVPESDRKSLKEGEDFKTDWTLQELAAMRRAQEDIYASA
jgi:hypothetical protein